MRARWVERTSKEKAGQKALDLLNTSHTGRIRIFAPEVSAQTKKRQLLHTSSALRPGSAEAGEAVALHPRT